MKNNISIYNIKKILDDERFILWCLNSTKDLDMHWQKWMKEKPEHTADIKQAKEIVLSVRLNDDKMPEDECRQLRARILEDIRKGQK